MEFKIKPVAFVRNTRKAIEDDLWGKVSSEIELADEFPETSLDGIETFSHLEVIYLFHQINENDIITGNAYPKENERWPRMGIFAQRKKERPNRLGLTIAKFTGRSGRKISVEGLDAIDGTPVIDIKPVYKEFMPKGEITQPAWVTELMKNYW